MSSCRFFWFIISLMCGLSHIPRVTGSCFRATGSLSGLSWAWCLWGCFARMSHCELMSRTEEVMQLRETKRILPAHSGQCKSKPQFLALHIFLLQDTTWREVWRCAEPFGYHVHSFFPELRGCSARVSGAVVTRSSPFKEGEKLKFTPCWIRPSYAMWYSTQSAGTPYSFSSTWLFRSNISSPLPSDSPPAPTSLEIL